MVAIQFVEWQRVDDSWSFKELSRVQTSYMTHDYHKYPAKFIPQLAARLIVENSRVGELVCDPFMGSGTTLLEAIINGRLAYGTDINHVAVLISKVKTTPIDPTFLNEQISSLLAKLESVIPNYCTYKHYEINNASIATPNDIKIEYWFPEKQKHDLKILLTEINGIADEKIRRFCLCAFSSILRSCSRWMMKSVKPTLDKNKNIADVYKGFSLQTRRMMIKNAELCKTIKGKKTSCTVDTADARMINLANESAELIVTSPPYVTSYEYADLHQLTTLWFDRYITNGNLGDRSSFIGSMQKRGFPNIKLNSELGMKIVNKLSSIDKRVSHAVRQYFFEMQESFEEMYRVLKHDGKACIVIGDTDLRKVPIRNAAVFTQIMEEIGFKTHDIIARPISNKTLPITRDKKTGRFSTVAKSDRLAYVLEHILIMQK